MSEPDPRVVSVNVGTVREVVWRGRVVRTAIWKGPVGGRAARVDAEHVEGDAQADRTVHGGLNKAVYAYAIEDYRYWADREGLQTHPGLFGENLTLRGIDLRSTLAGERWRVGTAVLEVTQPRFPCFKLGIRLGDPMFPKRFLAVGRLGAYLRVVQEGDVRAGDAVQVVLRPEDGVTLESLALLALR